MKKIYSYVKPYSLLAFFCIMLLFVQALCELLLPNYMSEIVNSIEETKIAQDGGISYIGIAGVKMLGIASIGAVSALFVGLISSRIGAGAARDLRKELFTHISHFSNAEMDKFSTASLITRTTNDVTQVQQLITMSLRMVWYAPIIGIGGVVMALNKSIEMSWVIALAVGVMLLLIFGIYKIAMPKFKIMQKLVDRLNLVTRENLTGVMVVRAFGTQKFEEERFGVANTELNKNTLFVNRVMAFLMPIMNLILNFITLLIVWVGAGLIADSNLQVGDMMAFIQYAMLIMFSLISMMFIMIPRAAVSAARISEVLNTEITIKDGETDLSAESKGSGDIEFRNVSFHYEGAEEDVIKNITLTAKKGETTAFIGSTGSGKSTLINLVPRFYDVTDGAICIDGVNIKDMPLSALRRKIGYVPQKGVLFSGSIAENLRYGDEQASTAELDEAAVIAQAMNFIEEKDDKYDAEISQGGKNVSGGQRQRLAIARALVKKAPIYIFDDSFSALDFKTDALLRKALKPATVNSVVLVVAQRVASIITAEQIVVLDEGEVVGIGTHEQLLENCETYKEIAYSQLSKEELK